MRTPRGFSSASHLDSSNLILLRNLERPSPLPNSGLAFHVALRALPDWFPTRRTAIAHLHKCRAQLDSLGQGQWHARPCLRGGQPSSRNAFYRIVCPRAPKNPKMKLEVSLRWVYSRFHSLFASHPPLRASTLTATSAQLVRPYLQRPKLAPSGVRHGTV